MNALGFMLREDHHFKSTVYVKLFSQSKTKKKRLISGGHILENQILNKDLGILRLTSVLVSTGLFLDGLILYHPNKGTDIMFFKK